MLMKDLEGTKIKVRSRLYQQLLFAFFEYKEKRQCLQISKERAKRIRQMV